MGMNSRYWINYRASRPGTPLREMLFKLVRTYERAGYFIRVLEFYDDDNGRCIAELEVREDAFRALVNSGEIVPFLLDGGLIKK